MSLTELPAIRTERDSWQTRAACTGCDTDLFYPERGEPTAEAKAVCSGCEVRDECLEYALANAEVFGIWGGKSEQERRLLRKERRAKITKDSPEPRRELDVVADFLATGPKTREQIAAATGLPESDVGGCLVVLRRNGRAHQAGRVYRGRSRLVVWAAGPEPLS